MQKSVYFLIKDILYYNYNNIDDLAYVLNKHLLSKKAIQQILKDEIQKKDPQFRIVKGALIAQNAFLEQFSRAAFYEVIEVIDVLKYCFENDPRKIIRKLSAQVILRLFVTLYSELIIPLPDQAVKIYVDKFKGFFTKEDMEKIINTDKIHPSSIFGQYGITLGINDEMNVQINNILNKFYLI